MSTSMYEYVTNFGQQSLKNFQLNTLITAKRILERRGIQTSSSFVKI